MLKINWVIALVMPISFFCAISSTEFNFENDSENNILITDDYNKQAVIIPSGQQASINPEVRDFWRFLRSEKIEIYLQIPGTRKFIARYQLTERNKSDEPKENYFKLSEIIQPNDRAIQKFKIKLQVPLVSNLQEHRSIKKTSEKIKTGPLNSSINSSVLSEHEQAALHKIEVPAPTMSILASPASTVSLEELHLLPQLPSLEATSAINIEKTTSSLSINSTSQATSTSELTTSHIEPEIASTVSIASEAVTAATSALLEV